MKEFPENLTFDDVLLLPSFSEVLPGEVDISSYLTQKIKLKIPLLSAAMDSVTEARTAICMAQEGGMGVIHRNMSPEAQAEEVLKVKKYESGMIINPVTVEPEQKISEALAIMNRYNISGVPVTKKGKLLGILTHRDLRFETNLEQKVQQVMTKTPVTVPENTSLEKAKVLLHKHRIEKLPVVDDEGFLKGLITIKDIEKMEDYPNSCKDELGRLRVAAAIGTGDAHLARAEMLINNGVDLVVVDTAHGHSRNVVETVSALKKRRPKLSVMAGNVATAEGVRDMVKAGADCVKVGIGAGSICTTRIIAGIGVPQVSAIMECAKEAGKAGIPTVADGGIKYSGDITKALAAGADSVMIGSLFAGTDESPGEIILFQGRSYKVYRGMGSIGAMKEGSADRYKQSALADESKLVPEGIEGRVPHRGPLSESIYQLMGGLRSGMGYTGCNTIKELHEKSRFIRITSAGLRESHVHDVIITKEAPNYRVE